jgi:uncharacterized lipoprotein NlpE involved in copper resistance
MGRFVSALLVILSLVGCDNRSQGIVLPSKPLTEEEMLSIARSDAETCNCGAEVESRVLRSDDSN